MFPMKNALALQAERSPWNKKRNQELLNSIRKIISFAYLLHLSSISFIMLFITQFA
jgi:hypothetical protein